MKTLINKSTLTSMCDTVRAATDTADLIELGVCGAGFISKLTGIGEGKYAWQRTDASGNVDFVTADDENKYPESGAGADGYAYNKIIPPPPCEIVSWADGTDEEIVAMVAAADAGLINLADYWSVGDTRSVPLSAMSATGVSESHDAQTVEFVLMHAGGYTLNTATEGGRTTCSFVVGMKNCLNTKGQMNSDITNSGSWEGSTRRTWCNSVFYNAIPSTLRSIFKQFKVITAEIYNGTTLQTSVDYFTLSAEKEIFGDGYGFSGDGYSNNTEAASTQLFQYDWYKTASNRVKIVNGSASWWWERSPQYNNSKYFCRVSASGGANSYGATSKFGLAPVGCI